MLPAGDSRMEWTLRLVGTGIDGRWCTFRTEGEVTPAREPLCDDALATNGDRASCLKHPIQNRDADGCLGLLGGEAACSQPRSDQCLVSAHRRFDQRALAIICCFLPGQPSSLGDHL